MLNRMLILISLITLGFSSNLFISEAAEGTSNNKYLEFYNAGDQPVNLSSYAFPNASNGSDGNFEYWNAFSENAIVEPGDVYVVCHGSADELIQAECDETFTYLSNGDDGFCLVEGTEDDYEILDCVGDWNDDPGNGWTVCGVSDGTKEHTIVRKSSVMNGNAGDWSFSAGSDSDDCEWIVLDQNDWTYLGFHNIDSMSNEYVVEAGGFYYEPEVLTIEIGDIVTWDNVAGFHDVVAYDGSFDLPACSAPCIIGSVTFDTPGTYEYYCSVGNHEQQGMVGTIIVNDVIVLDCEDESACNFMEPGPCVYPEENFDCDGNCIVDTDCNGECGGDAVVDECGECGGNGSSCAEIANLFYSEWAEGSSYNKYLEIYNASEATVSLGAYAMGTVGNDPDIPGEYEYWNPFTEGASIAPGDVYVVCHGSADAAILEECDQEFTFLSNGDDGNCLVFGDETNYTILDCIGDWDADPGTGWDVAGITAATADHTIVRKSGVTSGAGYDWFLSAGTTTDDSEWVVYEQNDWTNLGFHTVGGDPIVCEDETACNFGEEGSCEYAEENYDCDGNCTAEIDECGECGGDGSSCAPSANLFFSEAAEGSSNNKYLEIFNADDVTVDLSAYSLSSCSNGCDEPGAWDYPDNVTFEGAEVASGDVYVVCHGSADDIIQAECDQEFTFLSNGDDVFALTQISTGNVLDVIGVVGEDPGTGWDVAGVEAATANHTLVRKSSVTSGNPLWLDNPDTGEQGSAGDDADDSEWIVLEQDDWTYLGYHNFDGEDGDPPACIQDCPYFDELDGENDFTPDEFCTILVSWGDDSCIDDCEGEDAIEVNDYITQCEDCLANNDCEDLFDEPNVCEGNAETGYNDWVCCSCNCEDVDDLECLLSDYEEGTCELDCSDDDSECDVDGDVNGDDILNVLDVVQIVSAIVNSETDSIDCADMNADGIINVLDIVQIVGLITGGRTIDATEAIILNTINGATFTSDGYIGGIQMVISHNDNFQIELTENAFAADYNTSNNQTVLIVVAPDTNEIFSSFGDYQIEEIIVANSSEEVEVIIDDSTLDIVDPNDMQFNLSAAYPNPFNPSTSFSIDIPSPGYLTVKVFNVSGQLIEVLTSGFVSANTYDFTWNAKNMATGIYVINAEFDGLSITHNVSLIK
tara:strand:- start:6321 stop:9767 length:3447 start_codon:yes stop_codon:yes gene_type:complete